MSEVHIEEHSSPIRTPQQLIVVVVLAFIIPIGIIATLAYLLTSGLDPSKSNPVQTDAAIANRIKPVGTVEIVDASAPRAEKSGKEIVDAVCGACHATGALNAPKIGDKAAWAKLAKQGLLDLTQTAIKGVRAMPPRGGNPELSDTEIARSIVHMANQSGGNLKEPATATVPVAHAAPAVAAQGSSAAPTPGTSTPSAATTPALAGAAAPGAPVPAAAAAAPAKASADQGKTVYDANCTVCHAAGVAGAPKTGDKAAWAPRLKTGMEALYASSIKGKGAMPPKGGNLALSDGDVKAAVDYLAGLAK